MNQQTFPQLFTPRPKDSHKGTFGTVGIIGGASGMSGAVVLASTAAIYMGCGKVWAGFNQKSLPMPIIPQYPEVMLACADNLITRQDISAWVIGCGLGLGNASVELLKQLLSKNTHTPLLIDADGLNLLAQHQALSDIAKQHPHLILTPHPSEAARLLACETSDVQANRTQAVKEISHLYHATVVLKGHHSLVYSAPMHRIYTNSSGNPGLATAGSGDVLSGMIGALLAQGIETWQAVCGGVWLHGAAADYLAQQIGGEIGLLAGELPKAARLVRNQHISPQTY